MKETFKDYDKNKIQEKLTQVLDFESKYGENDMNRGWKKWCNDFNYRKKEWEWRQNLVKIHAYENKI